MHTTTTPPNRCTLADKQLVFVSLEPWDDVWRRNQFVCRELTGRGWGILFVEPALDWSAGLRRRDWSQFERRPMWSPRGLPNIHVIRPIKVASKLSPAGQRVNDALWSRCIAKHIDRLGWSSPCLWVNNQLMVDAVARLDWTRILYDITDDWSTAGGTEAWLAQVRCDDEAMASFADAVVVCSQSLADGKQTRFADKLSLVPNGVEIEHFEKVDSAAPAKDMNTLPDTELRLGYSGTVHPDRMDIALVEAVARARPQWSWVFIGPSHLSAKHRARLDLPNVHFLGPRPYNSLPSYLAGIDVCVTPHLVTPFTESLNPIKLWEYMAVGHPIVSTPVAGFRDYPEDVILARSADEWIQAIQSIAAMSAEEKLAARYRRRACVALHSWSARVDRLETLLLGSRVNSKPVRSDLPQPAIPVSGL